jgi:hypothetical protein
LQARFSALRGPTPVPSEEDEFDEPRSDPAARQAYYAQLVAAEQAFRAQAAEARQRALEQEVEAKASAAEAERLDAAELAAREEFDRKVADACKCLRKCVCTDAECTSRSCPVSRYCGGGRYPRVLGIPNLLATPTRPCDGDALTGGGGCAPRTTAVQAGRRRAPLLPWPRLGWPPALLAEPAPEPAPAGPTWPWGGPRAGGGATLSSGWMRAPPVRGGGHTIAARGQAARGARAPPPSSSRGPAGHPGLARFRAPATPAWRPARLRPR